MRKIKALYGNLNKTVFWITLALSIILIVISFVIPPHGYVEPTTLAATGELFAFATLATVIDALDKGKKVSVSKGDVSASIENETN